MTKIEKKLWCKIFMRHIERGDTNVTAAYRADEAVNTLRKSCKELKKQGLCNS